MRSVTSFADRLVNRFVPARAAKADTCYKVPCGEPEPTACYQWACRDENGNLYFKPGCHCPA